MQAPIKPGFQNDINGMRGLSVLLVVLYHFNLRILGGGFVGVDIFFVISGFLMTKIIVSGMVQGRFSYIDFVLRRATRIFPALFVVMVALLALGYFLLPPSDMYNLAEQALQAVIFNSNNYFAAKQGYFSGGADDNWLLHTWSLAVEWQFYLLYPPLVWAMYAVARRVRPQRATLVLGLLLGATAAASLAYCIVAEPQAAFFSVLARSWQMLAGGLVYMAVTARRAPLRLAPLLSYAGCAVLLVTVFVVKRYSMEEAWPGYYALLPVVGACMILLAAYEGNWLLNNVVAQKLGTWSYSIYLWHMPVVIALTVTSMLAERGRVAQVGGIVLSFVLGYLSYRYVEPARYWKQLSVRRSYGSLAGAAAAIAAVAAFGVYSNGFMFRVDDPVFYENLKSAQTNSTYDPRCENSGRAHDRFCRLNQDRPGRKVLVLGDSHAGHLYAWFKDHSQVDTTFFVKSGCPVIEGYERVGSSIDCRGFAARAYQLAASGAYDTVIISQHWSYFAPNASGICAWEGARCVPVAQMADPTAVQHSLRRSLQQLLDRKVQVAVLDGTPYFPTSAPRKLARDFFWHGRLDAGVDVNQFFDESRPYDLMFHELQANAGFRLLSLRPLLCTGQTCRIYDPASKLPIYRDRDHLNPAWMRANGAIFNELVTAAP